MTKVIDVGQGGGNLLPMLSPGYTKKWLYYMLHGEGRKMSARGFGAAVIPEPGTSFGVEFTSKGVQDAEEKLQAAERHIQDLKQQVVAHRLTLGNERNPEQRSTLQARVEVIEELDLPEARELQVRAMEAVRAAKGKEAGKHVKMLNGMLEALERDAMLTMMAAIALAVEAKEANNQAQQWSTYTNGSGPNPRGHVIHQAAGIIADAWQDPTEYRVKQLVKIIRMRYGLEVGGD